MGWEHDSTHFYRCRSHSRCHFTSCPVYPRAFHVAPTYSFYCDSRSRSHSHSSKRKCGTPFGKKQTAIDVLARRTRFAFLNAQAALLGALPRVVDIMSDELGWSHFEGRTHVNATVAYFGTMGLAPGDIVTERVSGVLRELYTRTKFPVATKPIFRYHHLPTSISDGTYDGVFLAVKEAMLVRRLPVPVVACWGDRELLVHTGHRLDTSTVIGLDRLCLCIYVCLELPDLCSHDYVLRKFYECLYKLTITTK